MLSFLYSWAGFVGSQSPEGGQPGRPGDGGGTCLTPRPCWWKQHAAQYSDVIPDGSWCRAAHSLVHRNRQPLGEKRTAWSPAALLAAMGVCSAPGPPDQRSPSVPGQAQCAPALLCCALQFEEAAKRVSQQLVTTREDGSEPELKEVQVLLYKEKVDGPLGTYLSMRDIKASGPLAALCTVLAGALGAGWEWRSGLLREGARAACGWQRGTPTVFAPSDIAGRQRAPYDYALPACCSVLQPEAYVSKLVLVPGIVTAASRPKHKATHVTIQCKTCK